MSTGKKNAVEVVTQMVVSIGRHAELRMKDRGISEAQVYGVLQDPREVVATRYGRLAAYAEVGERRLVVIYERRDGTVEVITALWVDERRLKRLGFTRV